MTELPTPISDQDKLLSNIAIGTPDIEDLIPNSRQEVYLKYIALNGIHELPVSISQGGTGATTSEEARANLGINLPLPVENGGTGATTAEESRRNLDVMHRAWLYDNAAGTYGTVTLSESASNFKILEIYYQVGSYGCSMSSVLYPDGKQVIMSAIHDYNNALWSKGTSVNISGSSITVTSHITGYIENSDNNFVDTSNNIKIIAVLGLTY